MKLLFVLLCGISSLFCHVKTATSSELPSPPHALTISGGSSLGIYEAGLNWVIADAFRNLSKKYNNQAFRLDTVTGASAGAVNAIMAAIHYCQISDDSPNVLGNPFFKAWNIDINELLPLHNETYDKLSLKIHTTEKEDYDKAQKNEVLRDSLFARDALSDSVDEIRLLAESGIYRPNCKVNLGIMVTHSKPQLVPIRTLKDSNDPEQKIAIQRFVIPLRVETELSAAGDSSKIVFRNNLAYASAREKNEGYLFLPEDEIDGIDIDYIIRAAFASSAFPLAFGRVHMAYCLPGNFETVGETSEHCPVVNDTPTVLEYGYFVDGGAFENIPLGVAVDLLENNRGHSPSPLDGRYVYIDPANRRQGKNSEDIDADSEKRTSVQNKAQPYDLITQIESLSPILSTYFDSELNDAMVEHFDLTSDNIKRRLLLTSRFPNLTGSYVIRFAGFFDSSFRQYDYAAGIYDGIFNLTRYLCHPSLIDLTQQAGCNADESHSDAFVSVAGTVLGGSKVSQVCDLDSFLCQLLGAFYKQEFDVEHKWFPALEPGSAQYAVFHAVKLAEKTKTSDQNAGYSDKQVKKSEDFVALLKGLKPYAHLFKDPLRTMIESEGNNWFRNISSIALTRLLALEEKEEELLALEKKEGRDALQLLKAGVVLLNNRNRGVNEALISKFADDNYSKWHNLTPDQISLDASQTGIALSWEPYKFNYKFRNEDYLQLSGALHFQIREENERTHFASTSLDYHFPCITNRNWCSTFSSIGLGVNLNRNFHNTEAVGKDIELGGQISFSMLANKVRLTIGTRSFGSYIGEDWSIRLGLTDIDALYYLFK